jgi:hypothetical protein
MDSPDLGLPEWEIFLTLPDGSREQVDALGTFHSFDAAAHSAVMVQRILSGADGDPDVLMFIHADRKKRAAKSLAKLAIGFYRRGIDPRRVGVEVELYGDVNTCPATNDEDTTLEPTSAPAPVWVRTDEGHGHRAPHTRP